MSDFIEKDGPLINGLHSRIAALEARCRDYLIELGHARQLLEVAMANTEVDNDDAWHDAKREWLKGYPKLEAEHFIARCNELEAALQSEIDIGLLRRL